jgi:hypothetical protein
VLALLCVELTVATQLAKVAVGKLRVKTMCSHGARGPNLSLGFLHEHVRQTEHRDRLLHPALIVYAHSTGGTLKCGEG